VKSCPTCGAACADDDLFCETDGTQLAPREESQFTMGPPPTSRAPNPGPPEAGPEGSSPEGAASLCGACGAEGSDDGDGYCKLCGHRLEGRGTRASDPLPQLNAGVQIGAYKIRQTAGDHATASGPDGTEVLLIVGEAAALAAEADAIDRIGHHRSFPWVIEREVDATGAYLALSVPSSAAQKLADVVQTQSLPRTVAAIDGILDLAEVIEAASYTFQPAPGDLLLAPDGTVLLARLRGAARLRPGERLDARHLLESLAEIFLAPSILGPTRLVRLLVPNRVSQGPVGRSIEEIRAALLGVKLELGAAPGRAHVAELCDPGLWRPYNQDSTGLAHGLTLGGEPYVVLVVCDGVSSSPHSERAATLASRATRDALQHFARSPDIAHESASNAVAQAIRAAHLGICAAHAADPVSDPPGTTIAAALIHRKRLTVGWVGDSRAYWLTPRGAELLTHDHSWVNEAIARGEVKDAEEVQGALAHTITKCLGPLEVGDTPAEIDPDVRSRDLAGPGIVVLCSDGLWNYAPKAADIAAVMRAASDDTNAVAVARLLVNYALARGGQDNVSVAVYSHR
jgi:serine/threonine protein phosphatase PrpC